MKISLEWLSEYVKIPVDLRDLRRDLSMLGLVVESVDESRGTPVLEIEVTSNRPDCLCHLGIAREVAALYDASLSFPPLTEPLTAAQPEIDYTIRIEAPELCPRYTGLVMDGIRVGPSPDWMQRRLESAGMRPVNNIVDITNYVLLEQGHPLHAFDFERLAGRTILVDRAREGQRMFTLDGIERNLDHDMLLINDGEGPVAIAGVMGGLDSEVRPETRSILLECAYFSPAATRRTSKRLGLSTEASYRFERGADWNDTVTAIARTCRLIQELAGGRIAGSMKDIVADHLEAPVISLSRKRAEALLGVELKDSLIEAILTKLGFKLAAQGAGRWAVTCPSFRSDMEAEADLIEEIGRFYGYHKIPSTLPRASGIGEPSAGRKIEGQVCSILLGLGYSQGINLSLGPESDSRLFPSSSEGPVRVLNPLTEDTSHLRTSLAPGLVRAVRHNFNYGIRQVRLFELGRVFSLARPGSVAERSALGILGTGNHTGQNWHQPAPAYDFFHLKGAVFSLFEGLHLPGAEVVPGVPVAWLNPSDASSILVGSKPVGVMGSLHPDVEEEFRLRQPVFLAEIDFEALKPHLRLPLRYVPLANYPMVERDLSLVVPRTTAFGQIRAGILGLGLEHLVSLDLMDVYEGDPIPKDKIGLTLRLAFQDRRGTLTVDQVQAFSDNILNFLRSNYGAELR